ncbi:MAG: type II toxin-antitoxin system Phd/YefM family antitoxin [Sulfobacillus sp.]
MEHVAIRHLRDGLASYLHRVRAGESLLITDRGAPVARLTPAEEAMAGVASLAAEGVVDWSTGKPRGATQPAVVRGGTLAELVVVQRR